MSPTARVIIVGNEVLAAEVEDRNTPFLLRFLGAAGTRVTGVRILPDRLAPLAGAVREDLEAAQWVVVSGGIGPTHDDCTREAIARALDLPLVPHEEARARLQAWGATSAADLRMAELPRGADLVSDARGRAFGFRVDSVVVLPGVPVLVERILEANRRLFTGPPVFRAETVVHVREGRVADLLGELDAAWPDLEWGSYPETTGDRWSLRLVVRGSDQSRVAAGLAALRAGLARLGA